MIWRKIINIRLIIIHENLSLSDEEEEGASNRPHKLTVASDYFLAGVENHASTCITNNTNQFIGPLKTINNRVVEVYLGVIK